MRTLISWVSESGGLVSKQLLSGWMWRATTAKTGFTTSRSATPLNGQDLARPNSSTRCSTPSCAPLPKTYEPLHAEDGTTVVVLLNDGSRSLSWSQIQLIAHHAARAMSFARGGAKAWSSLNPATARAGSPHW